MTVRQIYLGLLAYALTALLMAGIFMAFKFKFDPFMILTGLVLWPDVSLLAGLGRMSKAQNVACRIVGLAFTALIILGRYRQ